MTQKTTLRIWHDPAHKDELRRRARERGLFYRTYLVAVIEAARRQNFTIKTSPDTAKVETRIPLDPSTKDDIRRLAKASNCDPDEWVLAALDHDDELLDK